MDTSAGGTVGAGGRGMTRGEDNRKALMLQQLHHNGVPSSLDVPSHRHSLLDPRVIAYSPESTPPHSSAAQLEMDRIDMQVCVRASFLVCLLRQVSCMCLYVSVCSMSHDTSTSTAT